MPTDELNEIQLKKLLEKYYNSPEYYQGKVNAETIGEAALKGAEESSFNSLSYNKTPEIKAPSRPNFERMKIESENNAILKKNIGDELRKRTMEEITEMPNPRLAGEVTTPRLALAEMKRAEALAAKASKAAEDNAKLLGKSVGEATTSLSPVDTRTFLSKYTDEAGQALTKHLTPEELMKAGANSVVKSNLSKIGTGALKKAASVYLLLAQRQQF